ncbi:fructokinase-like 2, chloroplastic isoform X2 [Telopea speciosissima]|uniref:fructokinase-like 2, chloroplastic isoform X2 n=1 Tax=Telopea speciosissima TaxID=54955 RepID=UPI001CC725FD|nr:fructokinase-like 2, chloroplastic isoform X2 [Telopea speciosissima]
MASLAFTHSVPLTRWFLNWPIPTPPISIQLQGFRLQKLALTAGASKKNSAQPTVEEALNEEGTTIKKASRTSKRAPKQSKKKAEPETSDEISIVDNDVSQEESSNPFASNGASTKTPRKGQKKAVSVSTSSEEENIGKKVIRRRKTRKKIDAIENQGIEAENSDHQRHTSVKNFEDEKEEDLEFDIDAGEDISFTYGWPPLVCCFGAAQHAFIPSGRPANRLIDHEIHESMKGALWAPNKFIRAPGGPSSNVAVALASLGGRVAFMGKLGDDEYGQTILYYLNVNNVQTRSISIDSKKLTAVSHMKISKRGALRMTCVKACAEDSLSRSEINIDVLKEAKMFYFNSSSLLDQDMRSTTLQAIKISKKLGGVIFFDLNLPLPLWQSGEESKKFIQQAWNLADIIEVTKQELEFLCGIKPSENFDTTDNAKSKFLHYKPEVVASLWHENLKVLFVTNGSSKIHYYTEKDNGAVLGMEDAPITPFTCDMSASGDGIVAALLRMLTVQPHLITDKGYLEHTIKYAIDCGVIDQWKLSRTCGFPPQEEMEEEVVSDPDGIRSITEMEYRTLNPVS